MSGFKAILVKLISALALRIPYIQGVSERSDKVNQNL